MRRSGSDVGENAFKKRSYNLRSVNVVDCTGEYERTPLHVALLKKRNYSKHRNGSKITGWPSLLPLDYGISRSDSLIFHQDNTTTDTPVDIKQVKKLIRAGANVNALDSKDNSCLHYAVENENCCELISLLVDAGAELDSVNNLGDSPLLTAVKVNNLKAVDTLVQCGANINAFDNHGDTSLHLATDDSMISLLVKAGANIESLDNLGDTPLLTAVRVNNLAAVDSLVKCGANVNACNNQGETALHVARDDVMLNLLLNTECSAQIKSVTQCGCSPILIAIAYCQVNTLIRMIQAGADVQVEHSACSQQQCHRTMMTPLREAIENNRDDIVGTLLEYGANPNETFCESSTRNKKSPLWYALQLRRPSKIYWPKLKNKQEDEKFANIVELMITHGADVCNDVESFKDVIKCGNLRAIRLFLDEFHKKKVQIPAQQLLLHLALHNGRDDVFNFFLTSNICRLDQVDGEGYTAFHRAIELFNTRRAGILLDCGADINTVSNTGKTVLNTALQITSQFQHLRLLRVIFLLSYGSLPFWRIDLINVNPSLILNIISSRRFAHEVQEIIKYVALIESVGHHIAPDLLKRFRRDCAFYHGDLYKNCKIEIQLLRSSIVHDSITAYDILTKLDDRYARNENLVRQLNNVELYQQFPIYANIIRNRFVQSQQMLDRFLESATSLNRILNLDYSTFQQIYEKILRRLSPIDHMNLRQI